MVINQQATSLLALSDSYPIPDIEELVESKTTTCPPGLMPITNTHFPTSVVHPTGRKIPKIIHITSRYRCATQAVINNVDKWRFQNHSVYFHDDEAIDKLFTHPYTRSLFPTLREGLKCVTNGATKADLWRYLVVYIFGIMSQYFLASSVGHPLMAKMLEVGVERLKATVNVMVNNPAKATGPGACKVGFIHFMAEVGVETNSHPKSHLATELFSILPLALITIALGPIMLLLSIHKSMTLNNCPFVYTAL
ncbi:hypothetical protein FRACYDRAFT_263847 [Fragilariopsis cylindrus CCMP1102]|uniref:Uncharacterized protein n=1 Tax=Fragilariopsis cylindrus CCMP1102 TaxID=635003 RepID=A0A1E7EWA7_9STRA|nr:hypothetical protein FRACYDRAFT_263847 [Fragilariopsis cylindrus CCMP1102]|eukprot:OEU10318.1 hypothetical protein FRACYDRAFT_263847 [Fragilariopsis cylindrus CCMP1102]